MDKRLPSSAACARGARLTIDFEGQPVTAYAGEPLAVALFASDIRVLSRSIKFHRPRGFFCLSGDCGACLMRVGGVPNIKACRAPCSAGLRCQRQNAWPSAGLDLFSGADFFFSEGMDHHTLFTSPRALNRVLQAVVRKLGGLGRLPDPEATPDLAALPPVRSRHVPLLVVGGGPAGLAAATAAARSLPAGSVLLVDADARPGGSYLGHPDHGPRAAQQAADEARGAGVELWPRAQAAGFYPEEHATTGRPPEQSLDRPPGLLLVLTPAGAWKLSADRYLYATGAYEQNALFGDNDRPGIIGARACGLLLCGHGVLPGKHPVVLGSGAYATALAAALRRAGAKAVQVETDGPGKVRVLRAHGTSWVRALEVEDADGQRRKLPCDLVAVAATPAPASELCRQHGVEVDFARRGGFGAVADEHGRTAVPRVHACGDVTGYGGVAAARAHGERAGRALVEMMEPGRA